MTEAELIQRAKDLILKEGWTKRFWKLETTPEIVFYQGVSPQRTYKRCMAMAVSEIGYGEAPYGSPQHAAAYHRLNRLVGGHMPTFNDEEGRKVEDIIAKFDEALAEINQQIPPHGKGTT